MDCQTNFLNDDIHMIYTLLMKITVEISMSIELQLYFYTSYDDCENMHLSNRFTAEGVDLNIVFNN